MTHSARSIGVELMCLIYRVYDEQGSLIYLGKTVRKWSVRLTEHRTDKSKWLPRMSRVELRSYANRFVLKIIERKAISLLKPEYNVKDTREFQARQKAERAAADLDLPSPFRGDPMGLLETLCGPREQRVRKTLQYTKENS